MSSSEALPSFSVTEGQNRVPMSPCHQEQSFNHSVLVRQPVKGYPE